MMQFEMRWRRSDALSNRNNATWNAVERAPVEQVRTLQEEELVRQMAYLEASSPFYQRKFSQAGIRFDEIRRIEDLQDVPFTYKSEIRESLQAAPPFGEHCAAPMSEIIQMQASSGTTGSPSYVAITEPDAETWHEMSARCFYAGGIRPGDLVLHAFSLSKGFVGGIPIAQGLQYMGAIDIPVGADGGTDRLLRAAADLRPRALVGTPNYLLHLAEQAPSVTGMPASKLGVECIVVGGEPGGGIPVVRARLEEAWGATCCELLGGTDLGVSYWSECTQQAGMHMVSPDYIVAELIEPESGKTIPFTDGAKGELVYTSLQRQASPLVRFRSGDHVEVLGTKCECGRSGPRIRCVGRTDDMLIVRGVNVFPSAIQSVVAEFVPRTNGIMRIFADFEGHTTQRNLKVYVERGDGGAVAEDQRLKDDMETRMRNSLSFKADVRVVSAGTFEKPGEKKVALITREMSEI